jgi:oxygen-dependent protoporphyrinogen oxidase
VRGLERTAGGRWRLHLGPVPDHAHLDVDAVVVAVPPRPASRLLADACPQAAAVLAPIEAASVALVIAVVGREVLAGLPGSGVLVPPVEGRAVKAMTFASAKWRWVAGLDERLAVARFSLGRQGEEAVLQRDDADLAALALADAADLLGRPLPAVATRVVRWGGGIPQPAVGHVGRVAQLRAAVAAVPGLAVCGAALDGVGVPACIAAATAAAAKIGADLDRAPRDATLDTPGAAAPTGAAR